jgi:hypothetical protein
MLRANLGYSHDWIKWPVRQRPWPRRERDSSMAHTNSALEAPNWLKTCTGWKRGTWGSHHRQKTKMEANWRLLAAMNGGHASLRRYGNDAWVTEIEKRKTKKTWTASSPRHGPCQWGADDGAAAEQRPSSGGSVFFSARSETRAATAAARRWERMHGGWAKAFIVWLGEGIARNHGGIGSESRGFLSCVWLEHRDGVLWVSCTREEKKIRLVWFDWAQSRSWVF